MGRLARVAFVVAAIGLATACGESYRASPDVGAARSSAPPRAAERSAPPVIARADFTAGREPSSAVPEPSRPPGRAAPAQPRQGGPRPGPTKVDLTAPRPSATVTFPQAVAIELLEMRAIRTSGADADLRADLGSRARLRWRAALAGLGQGEAPRLRATAGHLIVVGSGAVHALAHKDGAAVWSDPTGGASVHLRGDTLVLTSPLRALSLRDGKTLWSAPRDRLGDCGPIIGGDHVAFYSIGSGRSPGGSGGEGEDVSLDTVAVHSLTDFTVTREHAGVVGVRSCPTGGALGLYAGSRSVPGEARRKTWSRAWRGARRDDTTRPRDAERGRDLVSVRGEAPALVTASHVNDGAPRWVRPLPGDVSITDAPVFVDDVVVVLGTSGDGEAQRAEVLAMSASSGLPRWRVQLSADGWSARASGLGIWLYAEDTLHLLSARDGSPRWSGRFDGRVSAPEHHRGRLFVAVAGEPTRILSLQLRVRADTPKDPGDSGFEFSPALPVATRLAPRREAPSCGRWETVARMEPLGLVLTPDGDALIVGGAVGRDDGVVARVATERGTLRWLGEHRGQGADAFVAAFPRPDGGALLVGTTRSRGEGDEAVQVIRVDPHMRVLFEGLSHQGVGRRRIVASHITEGGSLTLGIEAGGRSLISRYGAEGRLNWTSRLPRKAGRSLALRGIGEDSVEVLTSTRRRKKGSRGARLLIRRGSKPQTTRFRAIRRPVAAAFGAAGTLWFLSEGRRPAGARVLSVDEAGVIGLDTTVPGSATSIVGIHIEGGRLRLLQRATEGPAMVWSVHPDQEPTMLTLPSSMTADAWTPRDGGGYVVAGHESNGRLTVVVLDRQGSLVCPK